MKPSIEYLTFKTCLSFLSKIVISRLSGEQITKFRKVEKLRKKVLKNKADISFLQLLHTQWFPLQFLPLFLLQVLQYIANIAIKKYCNYCNMSEIREIYCRDSIAIIESIVIYLIAIIAYYCNDSHCNFYHYFYCKICNILQTLQLKIFVRVNG